MTDRSFPHDFEWGVATAAHQVEGGNWNNDWWQWEHNPDSRCTEASGDACDQYHRYTDDIALLAELGFDSYRFSLEWSRIEPEEGEFSRAALDHYRRVCAACLDVGVSPVVTFHHFTTPRWLAVRGGWEASGTADRFARFCARATAHLGDLVARSCTINEPKGLALMGYRLGHFPPGVRDAARFEIALSHLVDAHRKAYEEIKAGPGDGAVGLTLDIYDVESVGDGTPDGDARAAAHAARRRALDDRFLEACRGDDFVGVQTYTRSRVGVAGKELGPEAGVELTQMHYEFWPEALAATIRRAWHVTRGVPVVVTENGYAGEDDARRIAYVERALRCVLDCIDEQIDVQGYFYWSLLVNFEWTAGYGPKFGLIAVDRESQQRSVKPSGRWLGGIARANALPP